MHDWRRFLKVFLATFAGAVGGLLLAVALIDPYDTLPLSLPLERVPATSNQRYAYPALARDGQFDSAVFGTSTARLLEPRELGALFGASFVNLAMNSATAYEQRRIMELFFRSRSAADTVILGIDDVWCSPEEPEPRFTFRPFPPWLYDDNPWNDYLHLVNGKVLEDAGRGLWMVLGLKEPKFRRDGYENFLPDPSEYDLARAREHLYGQSEPPEPPTGNRSPSVSAEVRRNWPFPDLAHLEATLAEAPEEARKILFFVPYHIGTSGWPASRSGAVRDECKKRVAALAADHPNTTVLDFMIESSITRIDAHYWDRLHYTTDIASRLARLIHKGATTARSEEDLYAVLWPARE